MATTGTPRRPSSPGPSSRGRGSQSPPPRKTSGSGNGSGGRRGRRTRKRMHPFWRAIVTAIQALSILILVAIIAAMVFVGMQLKHAPSSIDITFNPPGRTLIYSSDGTLLARLYVENRRVVPISQIPKDLQNATVAFEDKRFYEHSGIDVQGIIRALGRNIESGDLTGQGGSTITQQLARNMGVDGLTKQKSISRKVHEWVIANQIEKSYTKQRILEMYLNQVSYGQGAYGVQAAAQTYFGKSVDKLDLAQCALLAGLPNRPSYFNPYKDKAAAKAQRDIVLTNMLAQHYITPDQYNTAKAEYIHLAAPKPPKQGSQVFHAHYFVDYVVQQLKQRYGAKALLEGNMRVETTLNWPMQEIAEKAVQNNIAGARHFNVTQGALVALDPKTGQIKAMVGGVDYKTSQFNIAAYGRRQPGSSFKAIVYSAAIDSGAVNENSTSFDGPVTFQNGGSPYSPRDDGRFSYRNVTLRTAMALSINVPAVKVIHLIGPQTAIRYARIMGVTSPLDPVLSLALGSSGVTPLEMADVYATIASGGNHPVPTSLTRIADINGKTIEDIPPAVETHVLKPSTVTQVDDMLRAVVTEGTGRPVADVPDARGKTGTTQGHKDTWFVGYTPQLVCAVWAGHPVHNAKTGRDSYGEEMSRGAWGMSVCAPIWRDFMLKAGPIYQAALAKEAAKHKSDQPTAPAQITNPNAAITETTSDSSATRERHSRHREPDTANSATAATGFANQPSVTDRTENPDGTTTATVDDDTGLLAPPGSPNSHQETFQPGAAPTVMSPQYDNSSPTNSAPADTSSIDTPPAQPRHRKQRDHPADGARTDSPPSTVIDTASNTTSDNTVSAPPPPPAPPKPQYVTVRINPEDGLLATKWTPQYVLKTYVKGKQPKRYSKMYKPPPGEH